MEIKLNLLENSLDFLKESLEQYIIADEDGNHHPYNYHKKVKWKIAFINLVQAIELLMKKIISSVAPALIKPNIDSFSDDDKSISFAQCITRLVNFSQINISDEEISQLKACSKLRNRFTHYDVRISSEEIKKKYCTLFSLYKRLFEEETKTNIHIENISTTIVESIVTFADQFTIFRGYEILKADLTTCKDEILLAQQHPNFIDKNGTIVQRIKFGSEGHFLESIKEDEQESYYTSTSYLCDYCDDCYAKQGEYHLVHCDLERCPICGGQALSCDCQLKWAEDV